MEGTLIASTSRSAFRPLAVQGILVFECYTQVVNIVRSHLGEAHVLLFAEPMVDNEQERVDWYTPVQGTPVQLDSLEESIQDQVRTRFARMSEEIRACIQPLKTVGDSRRSLAANILELALLYPDESFLYLVGEQPVVVCWGCAPAQTGVEPQDLSRLGVLPRRGPSVTPTPPPAQPGREALVAPATGTKRGFAWLPWLLALLLFLLLLGLGYLFYKDYDLFSFFRGTPQATNLQDKEPPPAADLKGEESKQADLRDEVERLRLQLVERRQQCQQVKPEPPIAVSPAKPPAAVSPAKPQPLVVPPGASSSGDLSFLEGQWICDTGLSDSNHVPVVVTYTFAKDGTGHITIQSSIENCQAKVKTRLDKNGILHIVTDDVIVCSGSQQNYAGQIIVCKGSGAQTSCEGRNKSGNKLWKAVFYRK